MKKELAVFSVLVAVLTTVLILVTPVISNLSSPPSSKTIMANGVNPNDPEWTIDVIGDENFRILADNTVRLMIDYNGNITVTGNFSPTEDNTFNLGSENYRWENVYLTGGSIYLGGITLWDRDNCLATRHFTTMGENVGGIWEAGYLRIAHGTPPTENQAGYLQIFAGSDDNLHLLESGGAERLMVMLESDGSLRIDDNTFVVDNENNRVGIGTTSPSELLHIFGNNVTIKLEDDSGNYSLIKTANSQLSFDADPEDVVDSTDIIFKLDGEEVGRFYLGGNFGVGTIYPKEKIDARGAIIASEGFATQLWDVSGGHFENAVENVEYYSPSQHGSIYGTVYRTYIGASLPSYLASDNIVTRIVDYYITFQYVAGNVRGIAIGSTATYGTATYHMNLTLTGGSGVGNIAYDTDGYTQVDGWVDYTK